MNLGARIGGMYSGMDKVTKRILQYTAAAIAVGGTLSTINSLVIVRQMKEIAFETRDSMMVAVRSRDTRIDGLEHGQLSTNSKLDTVIKGQEVLMDVAVNGIYDRAEIDRFRVQAAIEHARERRDRVEADVRLAARLDSLARRRR